MYIPLLEWPPPVGHLWTAAVRWSPLVPVVQLPRLLEHKVRKAVVPVPLGQHQREQQVEHHLSVVYGVARYIRYKPVPKLGQRPELFNP